MIKLAPSEAAKLAVFINRWSRPPDPESQREYDYWMKRLEGKRS